MKFGRKDYNSRIIDKEGKIPADEPVFLLRAQDSLAPRLLLQWAMELRLAGGDAAMAEEAENHAQEMIEWQKSHTVKTPDMYHDSEERSVLKNLIKVDISEILKCNNDYIESLSNHLGKYYNTTKSLVYVLMSQDLKDPDSVDRSNLTLDDFKFYGDDELRMRRSKIVIYCSKGYNTILKNEIE